MKRRRKMALRKRLAIAPIALTSLLVGACSQQEKPEAKPDPLSIALTDPDLIAGKSIWMGRCQVCHENGLTGAPIIGQKDVWAPRIAKGLPTLYEHAINGFIGPELTEMPPRGGFKELSDDEIKSAVRFMVFASQ